MALDRVERSVAACRAAYDSDAMDVWHGSVETALSGIESDTALPLPMRYANATAQLMDVARQLRDLGMPMLAQTTTLLAEYLAALWRVELAVATTTVPDVPPEM